MTSLTSCEEEIDAGDARSIFLKLIAGYVTRIGVITRDILKSLAPLIIILLAFSSFRLLMPELSENVHYTLMPQFDKFLFGTLPTISLQTWLWHGHVSWYDYVFYIAYILHYILVIFLALLIYKLRRNDYLRFAITYIVASFTAFLLYIVYPAAPPWLASQDGAIAHITRIFGAIYSSVGIHNYPSLYDQYAPNEVAAVPSVHATYSVLFVLFVYRLFGKRWAAVSLVYPICIMLGVVYTGEHYVFDIIAGVLLAFTSYAIALGLLRYIKPRMQKLAIDLAAPSIVGDDRAN